MNYKEVSGKLSEEEAERYSTGIRLVGDFADSLQRQGLLPKRFARAQEATSEITPKIDPRQQTYDLLTSVREPSVQEREALEKRGLVLLPVQAKSYTQVVAEYPNYFWTHELQYANERPELRDYTPPAMIVALNPQQLVLPDSFRKSRAEQLQMIEQYSQDEIEKEFPDAKAIMLPATAYAQADIAYRQRTNKVLFGNFFARALDNTSEVRAAFVGRFRPDDQLLVDGWPAGFGSGNVGAVPAVVFIGK